MRADRHRLIVLILVAVAARWLTFGNPLVHVDEEFYYFTGTAMWHHQLPFVDVWDRKPVGLFLLYALPAGLGFPAGIWAYQGMALGAVIAGAWLVTRLADRLRFAAGALAAGCAYILWCDLLGGQGGQTPVFYDPLMLGAALLILRGGRGRGLGAMALVGIALQIKYSVVVEGVFFGLWLLAADWRGGRRVVAVAGYAVALIVVAIAPTALAAGWYAAIGQWHAFYFANFVSIFDRSADPLSELARNLAQIALVTSPLVALAIVALRRAPASPQHRFVAWWLAVAIASVLVFRPWFDHYALPLLPPAAAAAAGIFGLDIWRRRWTPAALLVVALAGQIVLVLLHRERGDGAELAAATRAVGRGPGCLYVYSGSVMLYVTTGRCTMSRYIVPSHLARTREFGATGVDQDAEIARILAARPAVIVIRPPYRGERPAARAQVMVALARSYRRVAAVPMGLQSLTVYRLAR